MVWISRSKSALEASYVNSWFNVFLPYHRNLGDLFVFCLCYLHSQEGLALSLHLEISLWNVRTFFKMSQESYANPNPRKSLPLPLLYPKKYSFIFGFQSILSSQGSSVFQVRYGDSNVYTSRQEHFPIADLLGCPQWVTSKQRTLGIARCSRFLWGAEGTLETVPYLSCPLRSRGSTCHDDEHRLAICLNGGRELKLHLI